MRNQTDKANKKKHDTVGAKSGKQKTFTTAAKKTVDTMQVGKLIKTMDIDPPAVHFSFRAAKKKDCSACPFIRRRQSTGSYLRRLRRRCRDKRPFTVDQNKLAAPFLLCCLVVDQQKRP